MKKMHLKWRDIGLVIISLFMGFEYTHMRYHMTLPKLKNLFYTEPALFCFAVAFILLVSTMIYSVVWVLHKITSLSAPTTIEATVKKLLYTTTCGVKVKHNNQILLIQVSSKNMANLYEGMVLKINKQVDIFGGKHYSIAK